MPQKEGKLYPASVGPFVCEQRLRDRIVNLTDGGKFSRSEVIRTALEGGGLEALERDRAECEAQGIPWRPKL